MLKKTLFFALVSSLAAFAAPNQKAAKAAGPTDPQIAHIAVTANQIDVDAGKLALEKSHSDAVKRFAQQMIDDHNSVIKQAVALVTKLKVTPEDNATSKSLLEGAEKTKASLSQKSGADFDKAYADNEVAYHQAVINAVDQVLIPNAKNGQLKHLLQKVRPVLAQHLHHAQMLQKDLGAK